MNVDVKYSPVDNMIYMYEQGTNNLITTIKPSEWNILKTQIEAEIELNDGLEYIAKKHFHVETLETRNSDTLNFYEVSVDGIRKALKDAYDLGHNRGGLK